MAKNDKKDYQEVILALNGAGGAAPRLNRLVKVWASTEDEKLKKAVGIVAERLRQSGGFDPQHRTTLNEYCNEMLARQEPQWQILARRAGWTPPAAK